jgi:hypothetical protein
LGKNTQKGKRQGRREKDGNLTLETKEDTWSASPRSAPIDETQRKNKARDPPLD